MKRTKFEGEMTQTKISELRRLIAEATPGPWYRHKTSSAYDITDDYHGRLFDTTSYGKMGQDAALICFLRNNAEAILEVLEAARGLSFGEDWNNGTHTKIYRPKLIEALAKFEGGGW